MRDFAQTDAANDNSDEGNEILPRRRFRRSSNARLSVFLILMLISNIARDKACRAAQRFRERTAGTLAHRCMAVHYTAKRTRAAERVNAASSLITELFEARTVRFESYC